MLRLINDDDGSILGYLTVPGGLGHVSLAKAVVQAANDARKIYKYFGDVGEVADEVGPDLEDLEFLPLLVP